MQEMSFFRKVFRAETVQKYVICKFEKFSPQKKIKNLAKVFEQPILPPNRGILQVCVQVPFY